MTDINAEDLKFYQAQLLAQSGLALSDDKAYLLRTRLTPVALSLGYKTLSDFTADVRLNKDASLMRSVVEAMTTNETSFFRDSKPFASLREMLPALMAARESRKVLRIWSAACSSGQEAYSLAILLSEYFADKPGWRFEIVGTDISHDIIAQAQKGEYCQFDIQRGLSIQQMMKYFVQDKGVWRVRDELRRHVQFRHANLLDNMAHLGTFDVVFCRNVLIYFNTETKAQVLNKVAQRLAPDGLLFLGACETVLNLPVPFETVLAHHGVLRLKDKNKAAQKQVV